MSDPTKTAADFDCEYLDVHVRKEDLYWQTYMGMAESSSAFEEAEASYKAYIGDPAQLRAVEGALAALAASGKERRGRRRGAPKPRGVAEVLPGPHD